MCESPGHSAKRLSRRTDPGCGGDARRSVITHSCRSALRSRENATDLPMLSRTGPRRLTSRFAAGWAIPSSCLAALFPDQSGEDRMEETLPRALPRDVPDYHERQAAHFRALAETATTRRVKARLLREAEEHEQIAHGEPVLAFMDE